MAGDDPLTATPIATTTTNSNGDYFFGGLPTGDYFIYIPTAPAEYPTSSTPTTGTDNGTDNNDDGDQPLTGDPVTSITFNLGGTEPSGTAEMGSGGIQDDVDDAAGDMTIDFGFYPSMSIGSVVWVDQSADPATTNDGIYQEGVEQPLENVTVQLYSPGPDGMPNTPDDVEINVGPDGILGTGDDAAGGVLTAADGTYFFDNLPPGNYFVVLPASNFAGVAADYPLSSSPTDTADNQEDNDDNGVQTSIGMAISSPVISLIPGQEPLNESGAGGDQDGQLSAGGNLDDNGDMTVDFGLVSSVSVGSTVYYDPNMNGIHDANELGIGGLTVTLLADTDNDGMIDDVVATDITDANGDYYFGDLAPGDYIVQVTPNGAAAQSSPGGLTTDDMAGDGVNNGTQAGGAGTPAQSPVITLTPGLETMAEDSPEETTGAAQDNAAEDNGDMTVDFGFVPMMELGSTVFYDVDNDGVQDLDNPLESGISGITVNLYDDLGNFITSVMTDAEGNYLFEMLAPGDYQVGVIATLGAPVASSGAG
ncbi:MAG: SdrD B-like domain-containing protein [Saprospiraceae bacterium]